MRGTTRWLVALVLAMSAYTSDAQTPPKAIPVAGAALPFAPGEELTYRVRFGRLGRGHAVMRVAGPEEVRGRATWALAFDVRARIALAVVEDRSRSWVDAERLAVLRYHRRERTPLGSHEERVEVYPDQGRWTGASGAGGETPCNAPLDELSFIYFLRTLPLEAGGDLVASHHFDAARNPVRVRLLGRERVTVPAGEFSAMVVEMTVPDPRRVGKGGVIRLFLSDDAHRVPVRIETFVPVAGSTVMELERWTAGSIGR